MNDQQTANLLREIIGSRGSLAAASNNVNPNRSVQELHNLLINGKLCSKRRSLTAASNNVNRAKLLHDLINSR